MTKYLEDELARVRDMSRGGWGDLRDRSLYDEVIVDYPFGRRKTLVPRDQTRYADVQCSRGLVGVGDAGTVDDLPQGIELNVADLLRISEIEETVPDIPGPSRSFSCFYEVGFRTPKLLNFYKRTFFRVMGCDVVPLNVGVSRSRGWDVEVWDIRDHDVRPMGDVSLVVAYHVLEHVPDPRVALANIVDRVRASKPSGVTYFHLEVPIEPGEPRIRYAHLFPFERGDLEAIVRMLGLSVVCMSTQTHPGGPEIDRVLCTL